MSDNAKPASGCTGPSGCSPLSVTEQRNEVLTFPDGSEMELNAQMRRDCGTAYTHACEKAVSRRMVANAESEASNEATV